MFGYAFKCVTRGFRAVGHAYWEHVREVGYIMAMGYLPQDETEDMEDPMAAEYRRDHAGK